MYLFPYIKAFGLKLKKAKHKDIFLKHLLRALGENIRSEEVLYLVQGGEKLKIILFILLQRHDQTLNTFFIHMLMIIHSIPPSFFWRKSYPH